MLTGHLLIATGSRPFSLKFNCALQPYIFLCEQVMLLQTVKTN